MAILKTEKIYSFKPCWLVENYGRKGAGLIWLKWRRKKNQVSDPGPLWPSCLFIRYNNTLFYSFPYKNTTQHWYNRIFDHQTLLSDTVGKPNTLNCSPLENELLSPDLKSRPIVVLTTRSYFPYTKSRHLLIKFSTRLKFVLLKVVDIWYRNWEPYNRWHQIENFQRNSECNKI